MSEQFTNPATAPATRPARPVPIESVNIAPAIQQHISTVNRDAVNGSNNLLLYGPANQTGRERRITHAYAIKNRERHPWYFDVDHAVMPIQQIENWRREYNTQLSLIAAGTPIGRPDDAEYFIEGRHVPLYYSGTPDLNHDLGEPWDTDKFSLWTKNEQGELIKITDVSYNSSPP